MANIVDRTNALHPDLVLLLGDYAGSQEPASERLEAERSEILTGLAAFARFQAPLGVAAVLGNHDSWYGLGPIVRALKAAWCDRALEPARRQNPPRWRVRDRGDRR
jgi:predicted MPP superfamily phosphohydrolase